MLRELEFRGSNSVCGRTIQKDKTLADQDLMFDEHSPLKPKNGHLKFLPKKKPERRGVQVLDVAESARVGADVFIPFKVRLHPWTTIKVSNPPLSSCLSVNFYTFHTSDFGRSKNENSISSDGYLFSGLIW